MLLPQQMGRYIAQPTEWTISEEGQYKIPTFICRFSLTGFFDGDELLDCSGNGYEITGYFYIFKKDGNPNENTIKSLCSSLGWDGRSLESLNAGEWAELQVQLIIDEEEYDGKKRVKVKYINPRDYVPSCITKADPQEIKSLDARYGSKLRALAGAVPTKPDTAPKNNTSSTSKAGPIQTAKMKTWAVFKNQWQNWKDTESPDATDAERDQVWKDALAEHSPKDPKNWNADEWMKLEQVFPQFDIPTRKFTFGDEQVFKEEDIPF